MDAKKLDQLSTLLDEFYEWVDFDQLRHGLLIDVSEWVRDERDAADRVERENNDHSS